MDPVTTPVTNRLRNSVTLPRPSLAGRCSAGDALVAGGEEALGTADERGLGIGAYPQPLAVGVLGREPALPGDLLGRVLHRDQPTGIDRVDLVELGRQAGPRRVGASGPERLDEQLGI